MPATTIHDRDLETTVHTRHARWSAPGKWVGRRRKAAIGAMAITTAAITLATGSSASATPAPTVVQTANNSTSKIGGSGMRFKKVYIGVLVMVALVAGASPAAAASRWFDATTGQLADTGWPVGDTDSTVWAQAGRAAQGFCGERGFVGGFLNGHQFAIRRGVICVEANDAQSFDATTGQLADTGWPVGDTDSTLWAQAGRAAQGFCGERGFAGGFLNGHQLANRRGVICLR